MPINLCRHVKLWIHPDGLLPNKIVNRMIFQRKIRPKDSLTFFVSEACREGARNELLQLSSLGIRVKTIESSLNKLIDDKFLVSFAQQLLVKVIKNKRVCDSVYATDVLRLMRIVQREGIYSNNDVLFLNFNKARILRKQYLFGCRAPGVTDIHIFGIDLNYCDNFYEKLIEKIKDMCGNPPYQDWNLSLPGLAFIPDSIDIAAYGHLNFAETCGNIIIGKDAAHKGGERKLHAREDQDEVLMIAEDALKRGYVMLSDYNLNLF